MYVHALIPVKTLDKAKQRLRPILSDEKRKLLVLAMLTHVVNTLKTSTQINDITVVSPDRIVLDFAEKLNVRSALEKRLGLNYALRRQAQQYIGQKDHALLSISADLPLLTPTDIKRFLSFLTTHQAVLGRAKDNGTNAIATVPAMLVPFLFGKNSFNKYVEYITKNHIHAGVYTSNTFQFDIDTPEDYMALRSLMPGSK